MRHGLNVVGTQGVTQPVRQASVLPATSRRTAPQLYGWGLVRPIQAYWNLPKNPAHGLTSS